MKTAIPQRHGRFRIWKLLLITALLFSASLSAAENELEITVYFITLTNLHELPANLTELITSDDGEIDRSTELGKTIGNGGEATFSITSETSREQLDSINQGKTLTITANVTGDNITCFVTFEWKRFIRSIKDSASHAPLYEIRRIENGRWVVKPDSLNLIDLGTVIDEKTVTDDGGPEKTELRKKRMIALVRINPI